MASGDAAVFGWTISFILDHGPDENLNAQVENWNFQDSKLAADSKFKTTLSAQTRDCVLT